MSELAAGRERPVSGGLRALLGWLRRGERGSTDSLSSGGSDRTTASFAFLPPHRYRHAAAPLPLLSLAPPTDSYRRRLRDTNIRRHCERDITLHRKYRLPLGEGSPAFDAFTLPSVRRSVSSPEGQQERDRRATSESLQRRAAYVPGKRRAPPPPGGAPPGGAPPRAAVAPRRRAAKRPAPPPPPHLLTTAQHNTLPRIKQIDNPDQMTSKPSDRDGNSLDGDKTAGCKSEKYSRKESQTPKLRQEKSFLKQIFENRKRNSAIEPTTVKLLPNISELDRQAAELMKTFKLKAYERGDDPAAEPGNDKHSNFKGDAWFCTRCLKKYDSTMVTCLDCLSQAKVSTDSAKYKDQCLALKNNYTQIVNTAEISSLSKNDERQKLKEMLKEMKDSLPKRSHPEKSDAEKTVMTFNDNSKETPTLPMGSSILKEFKCDPNPSSSKEILTFSSAENVKNVTQGSSRATETVLVTHTIVLTDPGLVANCKIPRTNVIENLQSEHRQSLVLDMAPLTPTSNRNEPLKISSLLNPIYIPKSASNIPISQSNNNAAKKSFLERSKPVTAMTAQVAETKSSSESITPIKIQKPHEAKERPAPSFKTPTVSNSTQGINYIEITANRMQTSTTVTNKQSGNQQKKTEPIFFKSALKNVLSTPPTAKIPTAKTETSDQNENKEPSPRFTPGLLSKRRDLISQLEKSIASGDEKAAAEAAIRLAQLKMACSVLSFSSPITAEETSASTSASSVVINLNTSTAGNTSDNNAGVTKVTTSKVNTSTQSAGTKCVKAIASTSNPTDPINKEKRKISPTKEASPPKLSTEVTKALSKSNIKPSTSETLPESRCDVPIEVWVEDREAARGPIRLMVSRGWSLGQLRRQAEASLAIPGHLQRWVVGRALCSDDAVALASLAGPTFDAPFYLCLVECSETKRDASSETATNVTKKHLEEQAGDVLYSELVQLELRALVPNTETFECSVCLEECAAGAGAVLRECVHAFCRRCLGAAVQHCGEPRVACPATGCAAALQEREVRALVSAGDYERWLARGLAAAESGSRHAFHCRTSDCTGWALCEPGVRRFPCPVCRANNCVPCQAIHEGETCEQHRARLQEAAAVAASSGLGERNDDEGTRALLASLIARGEALECPECSALITKKWGCDWVRCSACKTEICWVTRGRRWGPAGRGDISAGCRCGVDGKRCHPSCCYCH